MKRYGYLFEKITDIENIKLAHKNARRGKAHYSEVKDVDSDVGYYCELIREMLISGSYRPSEYTIFKKMDKGKEREIYKLAYFPDRIIHHAIMQVLEPIWKSSMITDSYQSIKNRGPHKAIKKLKKWVDAEEDVWVLKLDVRKFYPSINNNKLKEIVRWKIKCKKTIELLDKIIDSCIGVPIGNYISQYFGNLYLTKLDHCITEYEVKYMRYCDDILVVGYTKEILWKVYTKIKCCANLLNLTIKPPLLVKITDKSGVDTLGYVVYKNRVLLRKRIKSNSLKSKSKESVCSYLGWLRHCNGYNLSLKIKRN